MPSHAMNIATHALLQAGLGLPWLSSRLLKATAPGIGLTACAIALGLYLSTGLLAGLPEFPRESPDVRMHHVDRDN